MKVNGCGREIGHNQVCTSEHKCKYCSDTLIGKLSPEIQEWQDSTGGYIFKNLDNDLDNSIIEFFCYHDSTIHAHLLTLSKLELAQISNNLYFLVCDDFEEEHDCNGNYILTTDHELFRNHMTNSCCGIEELQFMVGDVLYYFGFDFGH